MGHLGLTPQSVNVLGGMRRVQGRGDAGDELLADATALERAGAFAVVLESVPADLGRRVSAALRIPTVGIGAGPDCDAQILVWQDMAGLTNGRLPRFVRQYADTPAGCCRRPAGTSPTWRPAGTRTRRTAMRNGPLYDTIGHTYPVTRRTEPRIAAQIWAALGDARTVLNVGAGTGSYEPPDRDVTAVEPSAVMRAQRPPGAAPCLSARAEHLPFADNAFDAAMAVLSDHHWADPVAGLRELRRVARRVVVFQFDAADTGRFWLTRDYLPEFARLVSGAPTLAERARAIGARMEPVPIPWDCVDGFFHAYWRRPEAYLLPEVRRGTSVWALVGPEAEHRAVTNLRADLHSGHWPERNADVLASDTAELGARLLVA